MNLNKIIYMKYGELCLKGSNRKVFCQAAYKNISHALKDFNVEIEKHFDFLIIKNFTDDNYLLIKEILIQIPGFANFCIAYKVVNALEEITKTIYEIIDKTKSVKIEVKRKNKSFEFTSTEYKKIVANKLIETYKELKVTIYEPEQIINVEIKKDHFLIFGDKIKSANGLPVGTSGHALMLLSGGIDSPVAARLLMERGMKVDYITFMTPPFTSNEALIKVFDLINQITLNSKLQNARLYIANHTGAMTEISHLIKTSYRITLLRRSFLRVATQILKNKKFDCLATGDALGQVASQTIESLNVVSQSTNSLILRPLITYNKENIIKKAKLIKTYNISILPFSDSCSLFAPEKPVTRPKIDIVNKLEEELLMLESLELLIVNNIEIKDFND